MNIELYKQIVAGLSNEVELRHDVDISPKAALIIAQEDFLLGRKSSFYFRHDCPYYNLDTNILKYILKHGHTVGAHIDSRVCPTEEDLRRELEKANKIFPFHEFTFHINNQNSAKFTKTIYFGFLNRNIVEDYESDAGGKIPEIPTKGVLNLHPEWWTGTGTPKEKIEHIFNELKNQCLKEILPA